MNQLTCDNCKDSLKDFFMGFLKPKEHIEVLYHLTICEECHRHYMKYASEIGFSFNLTKEVLSIYFRYLHSEQDYLTELISLGYDKYLEHYWSDIASQFDLTELLRVQAIKDFSKEYNDRYDDGETDYYPFYKFLTKKICQKIDHLERCFKKSNTGNKE